MSVILNDQAAQNLLDFSRKLDIGLLDSVVNCLYCGDPPQQRVAQQLLTQLKEHPDAWTRVDSILEFSTNTQTKYYALQILEHVIKTRWKALPRAQCEGIKKYIVGLIIKTSSDPLSVDSGELRVYLGKLNMILVQILKFEWPTKWPTFISDIVGASKTNESLCQNNMVILKLLSEEVFDFSIGQMTQIKAKHLKDSMCTEFSQIFQLCLFVLENSTNVGLVSATLETLLKFLNWIPLGYIFETKLIEMLVVRFLNVPVFRNVTLKCLTEVAGVANAPQYDEQLVQLFSHTLTQLKQMLPLNTNVREAYAKGRDEEQQFIQNLSLFLSTYLVGHAKLVELRNDATLHALLMDAHHLLLLISEVDETEIFKICLEYWNHLACQLYKDMPFGIVAVINNVIHDAGTPGGMRRAAYASVLSAVRRIMISRMAKPEEVLVVENEQGEVVREFMKDTDAINMYKSMRETLVYLTHLDYVDTEAIMAEKLQKQVDGSEWSWKNLNTLCWAIGSISGAMHEEDEKRFLVIVIKELLGLCEAKRGKDNKAIVASNIMYVVGQYPRFLRAHWKFLKTVVNKLFEFMHETHDGVQDMACDTFIKIAHKCRKHFVQIQIGEAQPFVDEILGSINAIICDLQPQQVHTFYEAVGMMIAAQTDSRMQDVLIEKLYLLPNQVFDSIIHQATRDVDVLRDPEVLRQLANILKTNIRACTSIGQPYLVQLGRIYLDMLNIYKVVSVNISNAIAAAPPGTAEAVMRQPLIKGMRVIKKDTLRLISCWVGKATSVQVIAENMIAPLLEAVLLNYKQNIAAAREPEVLSCMSVIVTRLEDLMTPYVPDVLDAVFECTLDMINKDMEEFPEHRTAFFGLLEAVTTKCFPALVRLSDAQFKLVLDSVVWAFKHTMRNVAETGLNVLHQLLQGFATMPADMRERQQAFFGTYYVVILHYLLEVISDSSHVGNLTMQSTILSYMFRLVESGTITVALGGGSISGPADNVAYVRQFLSNLLKQAFPHVTDMQIKIFVDGLFSYDQDLGNFKEHVRDFLIQIREMTGEDLSDLYLEERETQIRQAAEDKRKQQLLVPGILGPHEVIPIERAVSNDDMND